MKFDQNVKQDIRDLDFDSLKNLISEYGEKPFRAKQIYSWLWQKNIVNIDDMTNIPLNLRSSLAEQYDIFTISQDTVQESSDGTIKIRFRLYDDSLIETVLIPVIEKQRFTICVSSQVGCSLSCSFCATGTMALKRNLKASEIVEQVTRMNQICKSKFGRSATNIVYMGMGEPLLNFKSVLQSIHYLTSSDGQNISSRRITISTAGIAKMIIKLAEESTNVNLALSLHAADDYKRNRIMPINESNNLNSLMKAIKHFDVNSNGKISFEYIAFDKFNDDIVDAMNLVKLCRDFPVKVNIIEYNKVEGIEMQKANSNRISIFADYLKSKNIITTIRSSRGSDIDAACGQLANKK